MNHAPKRWLHCLHISYVLVDVIVLGGFLYVTLLGHVNPTTATFWAIAPVTAAMAGIHLLYGVLIYPWLRNKNLWFAMVLSQALFDFLLLALIEASGEINNVFWILLVITISASAMVGVFTLVAELATDTALYIVTILGFQTSGKSTPIVEFFWLAAVYMAAAGGWLYFRRYLETSSQNEEVNALNQLLRQAQQRSDLIIQSIADGVVVFDVTGKISIINTAAATLTEWPAKEATGIDVRLVVKLMNEDGKPITESGDIFNKVLSQKQYISQTLNIVGRRGKTAIVSLVVSPILTGDGKEAVGAVAVFRDVTSERHEEKQRAEFISTASHEMRTPVAAIEGYLALALNDKVSTIDTKARGFLEKAHESTEHLGKLFQDLLTSARAEDGRLSNHPVVIEMGDYLEKLVESLRFVAQKKNLAMEFVVGNNELIDATKGAGGEHVVKPLYYTYADPDRIREVITNLFDNAVKYTDSGKISIGLTGNDNIIQLYVRDTGPGIPAGDISHLFQKFYRVDNTATRTAGGTGLGLFISRKIIELYKGRIWVESEEGKGSTFFINLPRVQSQKASDLQAAAQTVAPLTTPTNNP